MDTLLPSVRASHYAGQELSPMSVVPTMSSAELQGDGLVMPVLPRPAYELAKRTFDIAFALTLLIVALPVFVAIALAVRLTSPGPVIFSQSRPGRDGRRFTFYKFRTMVDNAEQILQQDAGLSRQFADGWKLQDDPRVTPVGRWLRKTSLDELPQLLNVLRGDMSVVGPRPPLLSEIAHWSPREWQRMAVKPGLTCLWQVSGRSDLSYQQRIDLDLEYLRRRAFGYDLWLVIRTLPAVLLQSGAT